MRLNLACGRAQLPTTKENQFTSHLCWLPNTAFDPDEKWVNIDRIALPGVNEIIDLFTYPWVRGSNGNPWNDSTIDEIWASHIVEHIPHTARFCAASSGIHREQGLLDGFYAWFYEAWRVLRPGGMIHITVPLAFSREAMGDPTHTRYILPNTFGYLSPNENAPFDYQIAARFELVGRVMAKPTSDWVDKLERGETSFDEMQELTLTHNNIYSEMYLCLEAIKDE